MAPNFIRAALDSESEVGGQGCVAAGEPEAAPSTLPLPRAREDWKFSRVRSLVAGPRAFPRRPPRRDPKGHCRGCRGKARREWGWRTVPLPGTKVPQSPPRKGTTQPPGGRQPGGKTVPFLPGAYPRVWVLPPQVRVTPASRRPASWRAFCQGMLPPTGRCRQTAWLKREGGQAFCPEAPHRHPLLLPHGAQEGNRPAFSLPQPPAVQARLHHVQRLPWPASLSPPHHRSCRFRVLAPRPHRRRFSLWTFTNCPSSRSNPFKPSCLN